MKKIFLLLMPLAISACQTPQERIAQYNAISKEKAVMATFGDACVITVAIPEKIDAKLASGRSIGMVADAKQEKIAELQRNMRFYNDPILRAWEMVDPIKGLEFNIYVTEKHICVVDFTGVNQENLEAEFLKLRNAVDQKSKSNDVALNNRKLQGTGSMGYNFSVPNTPVKSQFLLITPTPEHQSYQLISVPIVSSFIKVK